MTRDDRVRRGSCQHGANRRARGTPPQVTAGSGMARSSGNGLRFRAGPCRSARSARSLGSGSASRSHRAVCRRCSTGWVAARCPRYDELVTNRVPLLLIGAPLVFRGHLPLVAMALFSKCSNSFVHPSSVASSILSMSLRTRFFTSRARSTFQPCASFAPFFCA